LEQFAIAFSFLLVLSTLTFSLSLFRERVVDAEAAAGEGVSLGKFN
jgi:hypothetical protein